jgi:hypothetical protein
MNFGLHDIVDKCQQEEACYKGASQLRTKKFPVDHSKLSTCMLRFARERLSDGMDETKEEHQTHCVDESDYGSLYRLRPVEIVIIASTLLLRDPGAHLVPYGIKYFDLDAGAGANDHGYDLVLKCGSGVIVGQKIAIENAPL